MRKILLILFILIPGMYLLKVISEKTGTEINAHIINYALFVVFIIVVGISRISFKREGIAIIGKIGIWLAIFLGMITIYAFKSEFQYGFEKVAASVWPSYVSSYNSDKKITIARSMDGHFYVRVKVNNRDLKFMIDTGASDVAISSEDAKALGIDLKQLEYTKEYSTANGVTLAAPIILSSIQVGPVVINKVKAHINKGDLDISLLGMSVISRFKSFTIDGDLLTLEF